jgi:hypothetical protein
MPLSYRIDPEQRLLTMTVTGTVTAAEMRAHLLRVAADPDYRPDLRSLTDFTDASPIAASGDEARELARILPTAPGARRAVVSASDLHYGLGRMVSQAHETPGIEIRVFRTRAEALEWLGLVGE